MTFEDYKEKMRTIGRNKPELDALLDEAAEDPSMVFSSSLTVLFCFL